MDKIGTKRIDVCYDGKKHELTLTDYLIRLMGNTYDRKGEIHSEGFVWDADEKAWYKNIDAEDEINRLYHKFAGDGIDFSLKPIFRITS